MADRVYDSETNLQTSQLTIPRAYTEFTEKKYATISLYKDRIHRMLRRTKICTKISKHGP